MDYARSAYSMENYIGSVVQIHHHKLCNEVDAALALPADDTALREALAKVWDEAATEWKWFANRMRDEPAVPPDDAEYQSEILFARAAGLRETP